MKMAAALPSLFPGWRRHGQSGQALPLALALVGLGALALVLGYNSGQTVAARVRLTHVADAAAYSGALVQARALNLLASINRAQVGHQVAMAHLVTLASWAGFAANEGRQLAKGNPPPHVIAMMFGFTQGMAYGASVQSLGVDGMAAPGGALTRGFSAHDRIVHDVLERTSMAILKTLPEARAQAMQAIVRANYPKISIQSKAGAGPRGAPEADAVPGVQSVASAAGITLSVVNDDMPGYLVRRPAHAANGLRAIVEQATARYAFLSPRDHVATNPWPVSYLCPMLRHELRRRGATLLDPWGRWQSDDDQSYHALRSNRWVGCYYREYPMGWSSAYGRGPKARGDFNNGDPVPDNFSTQAFWRWAQRRMDFNIFTGTKNPLAQAYAQRKIFNWKQGGLPDFIALGRRGKPLRFSVQLRQGAESLTTTDAAGIVHTGGRFAYQGLDRGDTVSATSAAETYYERPSAPLAQAPSSASVFRPFWQARLVPSLSSERLSARSPFHVE
jgi:hypothetical protein